VVLAHALLAATHKGEFWPFSVYPMFSQAGRSWARVLVVEAPLGAAPALDEEYELDNLPGTPLGLEQFGIPQNDLSSLAQRTDRWGAAENRALERLFASVPGRRSLVLLVVRGTLAEGALRYSALPVATLDCDQGRVRAALRTPALLAGLPG
jgi:hypothetical protein